MEYILFVSFVFKVWLEQQVWYRISFCSDREGKCEIKMFFSMGGASASSAFCGGYLSMNPLKMFLWAVCPSCSLPRPSVQLETRRICSDCCHYWHCKASRAHHGSPVSMQTWKQHSLHLAFEIPKVFSKHKKQFVLPPGWMKSLQTLDLSFQCAWQAWSLFRQSSGSESVLSEGLQNKTEC